MGSEVTIIQIGLGFIPKVSINESHLFLLGRWGKWGEGCKFLKRCHTQQQSEEECEQT